MAALLGAAAALTTVTAAQAAPAPTSQLPPATSYRDLLDPIPDAVSLLKADDARLAEQPASVEQAEQVAQFYHHHHHHHHHHIIPRPLRRMLGHHHHHHHHHHHRHRHDHM
jgi:hypothetical protein